jgi:predicted MarR family transcription regulator
MTKTPPPGYVHHGYAMVYKPQHPLATSNGFIRRCRLVACEKYGVDAVKRMVVHHLNHNKTDDRPENIELLTNEEHSRAHNLGVKKLPSSVAKSAAGRAASVASRRRMPNGTFARNVA